MFPIKHASRMTDDRPPKGFALGQDLLMEAGSK